MKPPLTRPKMTPSTRSSAANDCSSLIQLSSRRALSRDSMASPIAFSIRSRNTSTRSPTPTVGSWPAIENSRSGTRPSVFRPTSIMTRSFSIAVIRPSTTLPSTGLSSAKLCSSRAAKSSCVGLSSDAVLVSDTVCLLSFANGGHLSAGLPSHGARQHAPVVSGRLKRVAFRRFGFRG